MIPHIRTYTGKVVNPLDLRQEDINIQDIAHALALCNRFAGHSRIPLSVAQHSIFVSVVCEPLAALQGLLHDAAEAYLGDVTKWLKESPAMEGFRSAERRAQQIIFQRFGCAMHLAPSVELADRKVVAWEYQIAYGEPLLLRGYELSSEEMDLFRTIWCRLSWEEVEASFLLRFSFLSKFIAQIN